MPTIARRSSYNGLPASPVIESNVLLHIGRATWPRPDGRVIRLTITSPKGEAYLTHAQVAELRAALDAETT